ncbi:hypothetical protein ACFSKM_13250 [Ancylobacter dichloromethanicus]
MTHVGHRLDGVVGAEAELVEAGWFTFAEAKRAEVPEITRAILDEVEARLKGGNRPWQPVPFYFFPAAGGSIARQSPERGGHKFPA